MFKKIKSKFIRILRWCFATLPRRIVSSILIATFLIGPISFLLFKQEAKAAWWNDDWAYRQKIQLTNSTGADLTDFQVSTLVDTRDTAKFQATCADMRFTDSRGQILDYWIEENNPGCGNQYTKVWIKVPKVYSGTNATSIYMYYGNPSASATQDGNKVFSFFDDFNDGTIDDGKWSMQKNGDDTTTYSETGGNLVLAAPKNVSHSVTARTIASFTNGIIAEWRSNVSNNYEDISFGYGDIKGETAAYWWHTNLQYGYTNCNNGASSYIYRRVDNNSVSNLQTGLTGPVNIWSKHKSTYSSLGNWVWSYDTGSGWTQLGTGQTDSTYLNNQKNFLLARGNWVNINNDLMSTYDFFFVRKYASADPTTSASAEETGPGPIAYWKFDEGQGDSAYDSTVNNNDGTLGGGTADYKPTWKPESDCVSGKCLNFDGTNDTVAILNTGLPAGSNPRTIVGWFNSNSSDTSGADQTFLNYGAQALGGGRISITANKAEVSVAVENCRYGNNSLSLSGWHYMSLVFPDGSTRCDQFQIYLDGKSQSLSVLSGSGSTTINTGSTFANIGGSGTTYPFDFYNGSIDEVKIYPYARDEDQIKADFAAGSAGQSTTEGSIATVGESPKWMTDGLVGHWKMDETSGTTVADASGNANTGTLTNAQETGTAMASSSVTVLETGNSLSGTDDAYNGMILRITGGAGCAITTGTERTITDYDGTPMVPEGPKQITTAAFSSESDSCTFEIRHQTGGKFGNGLAYDGTDDTLRAVDSGSLDITDSQSITQSVWINLKSYSDWPQIIEKKGNYEMRVNSSGQVDATKYFSNNTRCRKATTSTLNLNTWYHIISVASNTECPIIYINGQSAATTGSPESGIYELNQPLGIGVRSNVTTNRMNGSLDDVRIYNRALSPDEVKQLSEYGPGPVGWWKMDENVSGNGQTIKDYSGNGNNGTTDDGANNTGMDCTKQGKFGGGCEFDGADDQVSIPDNDVYDKTGSITVGFWIKLFGNETDNDHIISKGGAGSGVGWTGTILTNAARFRFYDNNRQSVTLSGVSVPLNDNSWHYISAVCDLSVKMAYLYIDGKLVNKQPGTLSGAQLESTDKLIRISGDEYASKYFNGLLDDVRIYNYARSSKQITEDMNAGHPIGGSPVGSPLVHYNFDVGVGGTAPNSGNGGASLDGTMTPQGGGQTETYQLWDSGGKAGRAADLDGTDDYISIPDFSY